MLSRENAGPTHDRFTCPVESGVTVTSAHMQLAYILKTAIVRENAAALSLFGDFLRWDVRKTFHC